MSAMLTLVLGIGAVSAMFSVVNSVLLKPLAGVDTGRLAILSEKFPSASGYVRARTYREWWKLTDIFDELGARTYCNPNLTGIGDPQQLTAACVTASWFSTHRVQAFLGRTLLPDEDQPGRAQVAVLDYGFWMRRFGGDRSLIGRSITLDQKPYVVVGVMPKGFLPLGKGSADLYLPFVIDANELVAFEVTARLRAGVSIERVRDALAVVEARLFQAAPEDYKGVTVQVQPLLETMLESSRVLLRLLLAASALVLLVACVNTANLFLARAAGKRREMQIRSFLGASARQLLAPAFAESVLISTLGGGLGLLAAWGIARLLAARLENFPRVDEIGVDGRVALVTLAISVATVFVCALAPPFFQKRITSRALVMAEVALTFVLLICSGLMIRSFATMRQVDLGYNPRGVILGFVMQPEDPQDHREAAVALWRRVRARIAGLPGVASVATSTGSPAGGLNASFPVIREGENVDKVSADQPSASAVTATGEYFNVVGIPLRAGRIFTEQDSANAPPVVIVSQSVADRYFAGKAVGRRLQLPGFDFNVKATTPVTPHEIVGVVADIKQQSIRDTGRMTLYLPEEQNAVRYTTVIARVTSGDPMRLERSIRHAIYEEAPTLALAPMLSLGAANAYLTRDPLRAMRLLGVFAVLAVLLAGVGVQGVVAYSTTQRSREMGIRMALGARRWQLFALVTRRTMAMAIGGAAIGVIAAYAATRLLQSLLFGVGRTDPGTYASAGLLLIIVAAMSGCGPALRAARTDPSITLRAE
jgi:putative ABC transport system permease protein